LKYHEYEGFNFNKAEDKAAEAAVERVAEIVAADMTEKFTMGVYIPKTAPVGFIG
jgi:hypothetical protein